MNTRNILILTVLLLLLVLIGVLIAKKNMRSAVVQTPEEVVKVLSQTANEPASATIKKTGVGAISDLVNVGQGLRCIYSSTSSSINKEKGVVYLDGTSRIRTDSQLTRNGNDEEVHVINNGAALYTWTINEKGRTAITSPLKPTPTSSDPAHVLYDTVHYNCDPWQTENSVFELPQNIQFGETH